MESQVWNVTASGKITTSDAPSKEQAKYFAKFQRFVVNFVKALKTPNVIAHRGKAPYVIEVIVGAWTCRLVRAKGDQHFSLVNADAFTAFVPRHVQLTLPRQWKAF